MRFLYDIFFIVFALFYVPVLFLKKKVHKDFTQKMGALPPEVAGLSSPVWIHAVSVGEAVLAAKLSAKIKSLYPDQNIIVSTTTQTGNDMIRKTGKDVVDAVFYYPMDISFIVSHVIEAIKPRLYIVTETELWPNLLARMRKNGIPVILANGRISDNSFRNYMKIRYITKRILSCISCFCMQSERDAERVMALGAPEDRVSVTGSIKFDDSMDAGGKKFFKSISDIGFSEEDDIVIAGSTHFPEENIITDIFCRLRKDRPSAKLIIAPRHIERIEAIGIYIEKKGLKYSKLSEVLAEEDTASQDIILVDTIGHLKDLYSFGSVVFVGGSLMKRGGQNPIEAARCGKAVIFGPHMNNFKEVSAIFKENNAALQVDDETDLENKLKELLSDKEKRRVIAENAVRVIKSNAGALEKTSLEVAGFL